MAEARRFGPSGAIPNSPLPLLIHRAALPHGPRAILGMFEANGWSNAWVNGVFPYHHFHDDAHEALGVARGTAWLRLGGPSGETLVVRAGDALVLPAGLGHKRNRASPDFLVVGAYPGGSDYTIRRGLPGEAAEVAANLARVPRPGRDPVTGGPLAGW